MEKYFLNILLHFQNLHKILNTLKKRWASEVIFSWNYRLQIEGLVKCLESPVWEYLWTVNMLRGLKHWLNQHDSIFVEFFDKYEGKSAWKILC